MKRIVKLTVFSGNTTKNSLVLLVLRDCPEEVWVLLLVPLAGDGALGAVGDHHRLEVLGDAGNGLDRVRASGAWERKIMVYTRNLTEILLLPSLQP